ncbi:helix-turn-helix transcriptional regulator [Streptomyces sp. NPDC052225]|uniref:AraC family transcriptional regulator n=1 Tax=Streptomyces sp. NPDC052225 TaxID=3154949 RepID=UPI003447C95D
MSMPRHGHSGTSRVPLAHRERIDWHTHDDHQLLFPHRGVLHVRTAHGDWMVPPHRAVWLPARVPHAHEAIGTTELRAVTFAPARNPLRLDRPAVLVVTPLLREVVAALTGDEEQAAGPRRNLEAVALDQLRRVEALRVHLPTPDDPRLADIARILHADPGDPRTLAELGAAIGASERTLSRLFRTRTGMTFPQWRTQLRLHHALTGLATGRSVTRVAAECGYSSPSAFIHAFSAAFGTTPGAYVSADASRNSRRLPTGSVE